MKNKIIVLGAGLVGSVMAIDLSKYHEVTSVDFNPHSFLKFQDHPGIAPVMGNIILGHHNKNMTVRKYECLVGGLPVIREWPFENKAVFSPIDVIEEYTRTARCIQNYKIVAKEALSDPELLHFDGVGTLESRDSDGFVR